MASTFDKVTVHEDSGGGAKPHRGDQSTQETQHAWMAHLVYSGCPSCLGPSSSCPATRSLLAMGQLIHNGSGELLNETMPEL